MTTITKILVDRAPGETRIAAMDGDRVVEVYHHRPIRPLPGAIYAGRVEGPLPDRSAVFVNVGDIRPAFMPCAAQDFTQGQAVCVEVVQPPRLEKGAKVRLSNGSDNLSTQSSSGKPGLLKPSTHPLTQCLGYYGGAVQRVIVTPNDADKTIASLVGSDHSVETWTGHDDLFDSFGVEEAIEEALAPIVPLPSGGRIHIEPTAAFTAVDVDAGSSAIVEANREALRSLAFHIRLRAIAGPVIVDLIPSRGRSKLVDYFKALVADDPIATQVSGLTPEGRLEFSRRRLRPTLAECLLESTKSGDLSTEATAYKLLRVVVRLALKQNLTSLAVDAHPNTISLLQSQLKPALDEAELALKMKVDFWTRDEKPVSWFQVKT